MKEFIDKLIERLEEEKEGYSDTTYYALGIGSAIKIVNKLAEEYKGGWIPCSEGLPENNVFVLAMTTNVGMAVVKHINKVRIGVFECEWTNNRTYWRAEEVIAWMPLPAPYTEGE